MENGIEWREIHGMIIPDKWMIALQEMEDEYRDFVETYYSDYGGEG